MLPELLAPAGGLDAALAAYQYGADAVYIGLTSFSARAEADNVTPDRLRVLLAHARAFAPAKKLYVTFNTLVQDHELPQALETLDALDDLAPDGVIVQDLGIARLIRDHFPRLSLHASTQLAAHSLDGVLALKALGFTRVVLARELTLDEIRHIVRDSGVEIEIFVHGALCYSYSGLCLFSSHTSGRSGNRGRCAYCCRERFSTSDRSATPAYPFSMRDLALAPMLDAVAATGAHSLKIEGRMKNPLYVACVTDYYRRTLDRTLTPEAENGLIQDLQTVFSRPWTSLYAVNADAEPETLIDPLAIGHRGTPVGRVTAVVRDRDGTRWLRFTPSRALEKHDGLQIELPEGGRPFGFAVNALRDAGTLRPAITLPAGRVVEVALPAEDVPMIPRGAPVFCSASQAVRRRYEIPTLRESALPTGHPVDFHVALAPNGLSVRAETAFLNAAERVAEIFLPHPLTPSRQPEKTEPAVRKAFERLGDTAWQFSSLTLEDPHACYAPPSTLNEARRTIITTLTDLWVAQRAARRTAVADAWNLGAPAALTRPEPARWSLKLRADAPPPPSDAWAGMDTLVLAIGHLPYTDLQQHLKAWRSLAEPCRIRLALPLISRDRDASRHTDTLRALVRDGWTAWECADLAGYHRLRECGITPVSADWSLYALNRAAAAELSRLGIRSFVLSPENSVENMLALCGARVSSLPTPEGLVFQHTPLFLSETAPCFPSDASVPPVRPAVQGARTLSDRRGRTFVTYPVDGLWVTVWHSAFCLADRPYAAGTSAFRIDLSWSPDPTLFGSVIRSVRAGQLPPDTHTANVTRGLA